MNITQDIVRIELDPQNPAQFFACCGVFEIAALHGERATASFLYDWQYPRQADFVLAHSSMTLGEIVGIVQNSAVSTPEESGEAPVLLQFASKNSLLLNWWLEHDQSGKSRLKLWAGQQTTINLVKSMLAVLPDEADSAIFNTNKRPMSGRFGLDPRSAWNTLDFGSSINEQGRDAYTFPATEMLAAIGLQGFRPRNGMKQNTFSYHLWSLPLPIVAARAAVAGALPVAGQSFGFTKEKRSGAYACFSFANPIPKGE